MFIFIAILSYFLTGAAVITDKFLISSKKIQHPAVYTFFVGFLSISTLVFFFPFGFHLVGISDGFWMLLFGALYTFGLLSLFFAFNKGEASRIVPVVGVATTIVSFIISSSVLRETIGGMGISGLILLTVGGLLISLEFKRGEAAKIFSEFPLAVLSGIFLGVAFSSFKSFYNADNFINVFIWTRIGAFLGALSLLLVPYWRRKILDSIFGFGKDKKGNTKIGIIFVANKTLGGLGSIVFNFAISLGNVAVVNALVATEYAFVFILGSLLSFRFPKIFQEDKSVGAVFQKISAIVLIGAGVWMVR